MSVMSTLRLYFRLDRRGELCSALQEIGVEALILPGRGRPEERINTIPFVYPSHGIVDIRTGPIHYVHLIEIFWHRARLLKVEYIVPDSKVGPGFPKVLIRAKPEWVKATADLRWEGKDFGLGIIQSLNEAVAVGFTRYVSCGNLMIRVYPKHGCWTLAPATRAFYPEELAPSKEMWAWYQVIAKQLLDVSISFKKTEA